MRLIPLTSTALLVTTILCAESGGGLTWTVPAQWLDLDDPRGYGLSIPPNVDAKDAAVCIVTVFPLKPGEIAEDGTTMGNTRDTLAHWKNEFLRGAESRLEHRVVHGIAVDLLDVSGTIKARLEGFERRDYRRLVAVAQGPRGRLVIYLNGLRPVVSAHRGEFESFVQSIRRDSD
jgi:hypothetical protein